MTLKQILGIVLIAIACISVPWLTAIFLLVVGAGLVTKDI